MSSATAREVTMKLTFARLMGGDDTYEGILKKSSIEETPTNYDRRYADSVIAGISEHREDIDAAISAHLRDWTIDRLNRVDLCIMRIAVYEMLYVDSIPKKVSINEAVKLSETFSGSEACKFVNGVLGSIGRELGEI